MNPGWPGWSRQCYRNTSLPNLAPTRGIEPRPPFSGHRFNRPRLSPCQSGGSGASEEIRTPVLSLEGSCTAIVLQTQTGARTSHRTRTFCPSSRRAGLLHYPGIGCSGRNRTGATSVMSRGGIPILTASVVDALGIEPRPSRYEQPARPSSYTSRQYGAATGERSR